MAGGGASWVEGMRQVVEMGRAVGMARVAEIDCYGLFLNCNLMARESQRDLGASLLGNDWPYHCCIHRRYCSWTKG